MSRFVTPGLSHVAGNTTVHALKRVTIGGALEAAERSARDRVFVHDHEKGLALSYGDVGRKSRALAAGLQALGLKEGDRVGVWLANRWEWIVTQMACALGGFILVTVNPAYRASEFHHAGKLVGMRAVVVQRTLKSSDYYAILKDAGNVPSLEFIIEVGDSVKAGSLSFNRLLETPVSSFKVPTLGIDDACNIQFTSGTTGHPKGSTLSHYNILNNGYLFSTVVKMTKDDVLICAPPLYHCFGCVCGVLAVLSQQATLVLPSESFNGEKCLDCISKYGGTLMLGVPTMMLEVHTQYVANPSRWNISTFRGGTMGGSPCPPSLMEKMMKDLHMRDISIGYGMTETSPVSCCTRLEDDVYNRCHTVGHVMEHTEVKIVDEKTRKIVPVGQTGELCTKGYLVMLGYWNQENKTKESIVDGWMSTGDLASIDAHGYVRIVGRSKDMIIRGGENIFPAEVEAYLMKMPGVMDVQVIGVPDEKMGEEVCAWIRPKGADISAEQVQAFCKGQIAHYKVPRYVLNRHEFPMTVSGKVKKNEMREETAKLMKKNPNLWTSKL